MLEQSPGNRVSPDDEGLCYPIFNDFHLQTLNIKGTTSKFFIRDDGYVEDIDSHKREILIWHNITMGQQPHIAEANAEQFMIKNASTCAVMLELGLGSEGILLVTFSEPQNCSGSEKWNRLNAVFHQAHEETHVLHRIGQIELLQQELNSEKIKIDLLQYPEWEACPLFEREVVANLGAYLPWWRMGVSINDVIIVDPGNDDSTEMALSKWKVAVTNRNQR